MPAVFRRHVTLLPVLTLIFACSGDGGTGPGGGGEVRLAILPGALLLPAPGHTAGLRVVTITAGGDTSQVEDAVSWASSRPDVVAVSAAGVATAEALGAAVVTAQAGGLSSSPILALVAQPAAGALLVPDDQVIGDISPVDPAAPYVPGWQYRVRLRGVNPEVGQVVLASGGAPVGGRVLSVSPAAGGDVDVVLELLSLDAMFADLSVDVQMPLASAPVIVPTGRSTRAGSPAVPASPLAAGVADRRIEQEFSIGNFECKAEIPPGFQFPIALDNFDVEVFPQLTLDLSIVQSGLRRLVVHGSVAAQIRANPLITAALEAKAECLYTAKVIILPIGGPVSLIFGGQVPVGVGFEAGAKATFGQLGFDAFHQASLSTSFGIDCPLECQVVAEMSSTPPEGFFKPRIPSFEDDLRFELTGSAFAFAKLTIGNPKLKELRFEVVELKLGAEQKFELAGRTAQANDATYASAFALKPVLEFKTSSKLQAVANLLEVTLAELSFAPELPVISQSPRGTFTITPGAVAAGDESGLGEPATFTVTLDPVDYFGAYAVESVDILHRTGAGTLEPGRPGCTRVEAASGQTVFSCQTDFLETDAGPQTYHAFVNARIFGVPVPVSLEVAPDGKATVEVTTDEPLPTDCRNIVLVSTFPSPHSANPPDTVMEAGSEGVRALRCARFLRVYSGVSEFASLTHVLNELIVLSGQASFPGLTYIGNQMQFITDDQAVLGLPNLAIVGDGSNDNHYLRINGAGALTTLGIGAAHFTGSLDIVNNPLLASIAGVSCGIVAAELSIINNPVLPTAMAQGKADCIQAPETQVSGNGP